MNAKSLRTLEFNKIKDMLASYALTPLGEARCLDLLPSSKLQEVERRQLETEEALRVLTYRGDHPLIPFKDVSNQVSLSEKGATSPPGADRHCGIPAGCKRPQGLWHRMSWNAAQGSARWQPVWSPIAVWKRIFLAPSSPKKKSQTMPAPVGGHPTAYPAVQ